MRVYWAFAAALLFAFAAPASGQLRNCNLGQRPGAQDAVFSNVGQPNQVTLLFLAEITCSDGLRILADQATHSEASGIIQLFGNVNVTDADRILRSENAIYYTRQRHMQATGSVVVTQRATGSVIRSDNLVYYERGPTRQQSQMVATRTSATPARAILFGERAPAGQVRADSMIVDANEIHILDERYFRATGDATMTRDSLRATAYQIEYDQQDGTLQVLGGGMVTLPSYQLRGDSITATVGADDEIETVLTRHGSTLQSEQMQVDAPAIRLFFQDGGIARMVAMNWPAMQNAPTGNRPVAVSEQFRMEADSLDVLAPEQQLTEAVAVGQAFVERVTPDSLRRYLPEADANVLRLIQNDWMRGDTVRAFFTAAPAAGEAGAAAVGEAAGGGNGERVMERLAAIGGPAQAMHRMRQENAEPESRMSIAYLVGSRVEVEFSGGVVTEVRAAQDVRGVYLQPADAARRAAATSGGRTP